MRLRLHRKTKYAIAVLTLLVVVLVVGLSMLSNWEEKKYRVEETPESEASPLYEDEGTPMTYYDGVWYVPKEHLETILVLGLDEYAAELPADKTFQNNQNADFLLLLVLDHDQKRYTSVHINRDTMTEVPILAIDGTMVKTATKQILTAHNYGSGGKDSCENTAKAVSGLLYGAKIDHYVSLTMDAVAKVNDLAGGVRLEILDDFSAVDPALVQGSEVTLLGEQALTYVRARHGLEDSSNLHRMERQRQYLHALHGQIEAAIQADPNFFPETVMAVSDYLVSDCTVTQLSQICESVIGYESDGIQTMEGESVVNTYMEFYPDGKALKDLILHTFYTPAEEQPAESE